eukprot:3055407-Rhodomonas_salina.4
MPDADLASSAPGQARQLCVPLCHLSRPLYEYRPGTKLHCACDAEPSTDGKRTAVPGRNPGSLCPEALLARACEPV